MGAWYIRITGKHRKEVDLDLLIQAVLVLGEQLREEERQAAAEQAAQQTDNSSGDEAAS